MSFDLFVGCFVRGAPATFPRERLEAHFGPFVSHRGPRCWTLEFGADGKCYLYGADRADISTINVNRPVASAKFYRALFNLMQEQPTVLAIPGDCPPLVAHAEHVAHVPGDLVQARGAAVVLQSAADVPTWIARA
jgi:hypothetical protein